MGRHADDLRLVGRVLARDREAVHELADRLACVPAFLRARAARCGLELAPAALDDLAQSTFLAIWTKLATYRGDSRLETWACGFCWNQLRGWRERLARTEGTRALLEERGASAPTPDDTHEAVDRALEQLGRPGSDVIRLKHYEELSFPEIGARLDLSPNTAKSLYYRGLARLRTALGTRGEELVG